MVVLPRMALMHLHPTMHIHLHQKGDWAIVVMVSISCCFICLSYLSFCLGYYSQYYSSSYPKTKQQQYSYHAYYEDIRARRDRRMASPPDGYEQRRRESAPVVSLKDILMEIIVYLHVVHVESTSTRKRNKCIFLPVHLHGMCNLHVDMCYDRPCVTIENDIETKSKDQAKCHACLYHVHDLY